MPLPRRTSGWILRALGLLPLFAFAYGLPPKLLEQSFRADAALAKLVRRDSAKIEVVSAEPVLHGGMALSRDRQRIQVLSPDGSRVREYGATPKPSEKPAGRELREEIFTHDRTVGAFRLGPDRLSFRPSREEGAPVDGDLWSVSLGFEPQGMGSHPATGTLLGWGAHPSWLFVFPPDRRTMVKIAWPEDAEPVHFAPCDARRAILIENLSDGLSRAVFFDNNRPQAYSLFDFSQNKRLSTVTAAAVRSCDEFVVAGNFGVARVRYGK